MSLSVTPEGRLHAEKKEEEEEEEEKEREKEKAPGLSEALERTM